MNKEALEFYIESKNLLADKTQSKLAEDKKNSATEKLSFIADTYEEKQANFKENAIKFVKAHPKATENAIVGGLMGGGSELAMPSQYDMTGQPATNMSRIGKRALLGAAMGGVGGEIKSNVRGHISKLAASKEAGAAVREAESAEYGACRLALDDRTVVFRVAKTTPTKVGQFVTLWKRPSPDAEIAPLDSSDGVSLVVVSVGDATFRGQFVFPQKTLLEKGIMSRSHKGGKRAFRVYPPWSKPVVPEAVHTQKWQMRYFLPLPLEGDAGLARVGLGVGDALIGANAGYVHKSKKDRNRSTSGPGTAEKGKIVEMPFGRKATSSPIPKTDKSPKGTLVQFPPPEKLAGMLSPMLQRAGGMIAKNPRAASAVLGAGAGLASNELTGADAPVFSAVAGGALGALGGKQLLRSTVNRAKPLLGKDVASGAVNVMKQNRASQLALKPPTSVNMGATQQAAAKMRPVANTQAARTLPVGKGSTNYNTTASSLPSQTSFNPTQVASNKPQTNLPGVSFREGPVASPVMPQKQDPMAGYRPSRSTIPQLAPQRGSMAKSTFDPSLAQTMSKLAHIMKW